MEEMVDSPRGVNTLKDGMVMWLDIRTDSVGMHSPGYPWPHVTYYFPYFKMGLLPSGNLCFISVLRCISYILSAIWGSMCLHLSPSLAVF